MSQGPPRMDGEAILFIVIIAIMASVAIMLGTGVIHQ